MGAAAEGWKKNGLIIARFIGMEQSGMERQWEPHTAQGCRAVLRVGEGVHPYMASPHGTHCSTGTRC